jgi:probable rRNA maturation factor
VSNRVLLKYNKNWSLDRERVLILAKKVLRENNLDGVELSLLFCGRIKAKKLNEHYRQMSYVPQVLSFPLKSEVERDGLRRLGDIVICNEKLKYETVFLKRGIYPVLLDWLRHGMEALRD